MRDRGLDLIKFLAILTMVVDHCRFIFPSFQSYLMAVGRWAFPLFAFAIALNTFRALTNNKISTIKSYCINLILFSCISEIPYRLMVGKSIVFNVMPTLLLGFLFIVLLYKAESKLKSILFFICGVGVLLPVQHYFEYGLMGILLIVSFYWFVSTKGLLKALSFLACVCFALFCNLQYYYSLIEVLGLFNVYTNYLIVSILAVMAFIFTINNYDIVKFNVPKMGKWAYWFYPVHMLLIFAIMRYL